MITLIILQAAQPSSGGTPSYLLIGAFFVILVLIILLFSKNKNSQTKQNIPPANENKPQPKISVLAIITIIVGVTMYFGSISLEKQGRQLHEDTYWGKAPVESFHTADSMVETSGYLNKGGIVLGIAGALWLVLAAITNKRATE